MNLKNIYILLCFFGAALPLSQFIPWVAAHGLDLTLFFHQLSSSQIGRFFAMDVIISAIVLFVFIFHEGRRRQINNLWLPVIATLTVGVSVGLPLFLYMRQRKIDA